MSGVPRSDFEMSIHTMFFMYFGVNIGGLVEGPCISFEDDVSLFVSISVAGLQV